MGFVPADHRYTKRAFVPEGRGRQAGPAIGRPYVCGSSPDVGPVYTDSDIFEPICSYVAATSCYTNHGAYYDDHSN